jgi:Flp pilus assembly protein TadB
MMPIMIAIGIGMTVTLLWIAGALLVGAPRLRPAGRLTEKPQSHGRMGLAGLVKWIRSMAGFPQSDTPDLVGLKQGAPDNRGRGRIARLVTACVSPSAAWHNRRRLRRIREQLPEALDVMARALRAGHAVPTSLAMVVEESADPIRREFALAVEDMRFGKSLPDALKSLAARVDLEEVHFWITCLLIQRETGGSLPQMLDEVSRLIRARMEFDAKVKALSAEARFSAVVLAGLPVVLAGLIFLVNPDYLAPLWTNPLGQGLAVTALVLMGCGVIVMRRMMRIAL